MASNIVTVLLNARDNISGTVSGLKQNLLGLGSAANGVSGGFEGMSSSLAGASISAGLIGTALEAATSAAQLFTTQLMTASKIQTDMTVAGETIGKNMGLGLEGGMKILKETRLELGKVADALPGVTADYTNVANSVMPQLSKLGFSQEELKKYSVSISTGGGFMGATTGMGATVGANMSKLLAGSTSISRLMQNDVFERYTGDAKGKMAESLAAAGVKEKDWGTISGKKRAEIVADFASKIATPELAAELSKGLDSKLAALTSYIFDPERGILGFLKPVAARGGRTALDAVTELFDMLMKFGDFFAGVDSGGVMTAIVDVVDWFTRLGYTVMGMLRGGDNAIGDISADLFNGIIDWVNKFMGQMAEAIQKVPWGKIGFVLGQVIGNLFLAIQNIDWLGVLRGQFWVFKSLFELIGGILIGAVTTLISGTLAKMEERFRWLQKIFNGVFGAIGSAIDGFASAFRAIWDGAVKAIQPIVDFFVKGFENTVGAVKAATQPVAAVATAATNTVNSIGAGVNDFFKPLENTLNQGLSNLTGGKMGGDSTTPTKIGETTPIPTTNTPSSNNTQAFAPTINLQANANMSTADHVDMLMNALNNKYREYQQGVLA